MKPALIASAALLGYAFSLSASPIAPTTDVERKLVLESLAEILEVDYIDPEMGGEISAALAAKLANGAYRALGDPDAFATQLTADLLEVSQDLHFNVALDPDWIVAQRQKDDPEVARRLLETERAQARQRNYGFREVRMLEGNVGYLNFTYFDDPELAHDTVAAVMKLLSGTDALILDLRFNNGGYLEMAQLLCSYYLRSLPSQMLFDFFDLEDGKRIERQEWVLPSVSGQRMPEVPLYLLTSSTSFSSAEWFAFILKNLGRATVVGEQTAGGAHPVNRRALNDRFVLQVPTGEIKDGVLGEDFEGVGVEPHIAVSSEVALHTAHREALNALMEREPESRASYAWFLPAVEARLEAPRIEATLLEGLIGSYGSRQILMDGEKLYYSWNGEDRLRLHPLGGRLLALEGVDDFRFRIQVREGIVVGLERLFMDGRVRLHSKTGARAETGRRNGAGSEESGEE